MFYFLRYGNKLFIHSWIREKLQSCRYDSTVRFRAELCLCAIASGSIHHLAFTKSGSITISATQIYHGSREFGRFTGHLLSCVRLGQGLVFKLLVELSVHPFGAPWIKTARYSTQVLCSGYISIGILSFFLCPFWCVVLNSFISFS